MKFKQLLKQNHLSIYMLARKANIPYMTINDLVNGRTNFANMSLKNAIAISKVLKMDVFQTETKRSLGSSVPSIVYTSLD